MKIPYYFGMTVLLFMASASYSYSSYHNTNLVEQIKPNPMARSKPTHTQFASVQFLESDTDLTFKNKAGDVKTRCAALGYPLEVSQCSGALKPSYLCSSEISDADAANYTSGCCNSNLYTADNSESCQNNATAVNDFCYWGGKKKYRCSCNRNRYPYSTLAGEGCGNLEFNANDKCVATNADGVSVSYYASCVPAGYQECNLNDHLVGKGLSARVERNGNTIVLYESCECSASFDTYCPTEKLINAGKDYICTDYRNKQLTHYSNCETDCTQTAETNLDNYLYGKAWHCLYRKDGASLKTTEDQCTYSGNNSYYDECANQGFIKSESDCYISDLILRCPNDSTKVWCLDSKYCTGYPVADTACNVGANINECAERAQGVRCVYQLDECNKCWDDGKNKGSGCVNDTGDRGDVEKCCKKGFKFSGGKCVRNICDADEYPYDQNPGKDQGKLEICYEGSTSTTVYNYTAHFGYDGCNGDLSKGEMWIKDTPNGRRCVCDRKGTRENSPGFPFTLDLFFDSNADTTDSYSHVGFNQGAYGFQTSCTDGDGSYYGYTSCFIGSQMTGPKGMCLRVGAVGHTTTYPYYPDTQGLANLKRVLGETAYSRIGRTYPVTNNSLDESKVYCINKKTHGAINTPSGTSAIIEGCDNGYESACSAKCYNVANVVKSGEKYTWNSEGFQLLIHTYNSGTMNLGFEKCPAGFLKGGTYGSCYKECTTDNLAACDFGDVVKKGSAVVGVVYAKDGNSGVSCGTSSSLHILATGHKDSITWSEADAWVKTYAPTGLESDVTFKAGNWRLPNNTEMGSGCLAQYSMYTMQGTMNALGAAGLENSWTSDTSGYYRGCCSTLAYAASNTANKKHARPVIVLDYTKKY